MEPLPVALARALIAALWPVALAGWRDVPALLLHLTAAAALAACAVTALAAGVLHAGAASPERRPPRVVGLPLVMVPVVDRGARAPVRAPVWRRVRAAAGRGGRGLVALGLYGLVLAAAGRSGAPSRRRAARAPRGDAGRIPGPAGRAAA